MLRRAALLALLCSAHVAAADARDDAKREFTAGQAADKQGDYQGAIEHYLRAYDYVAHPFALYNVAVDYEQLGKLREAAHYYQTYLEAPEATDRERVRAKIAELKSKPSRFDVVTDPDGAKLSVDGQSYGTTPFSGRLKGGAHRIVVERDDKRDEKTVTVEFGEPVQLTFDLGGHPGTIIIQGMPIGADVAIDGERAGTLPFSEPLPAGPHKVRVTREGYRPFEQEAVIAGGQTTVIRPNLVRDLDGSGGTGTGEPVKILYEVGGGGGADIRGNGAAYGGEVGIRGLNYELAVLFGKVLGNASVELQLRYAFGKARVQPVIGGGYSYLAGGASGAGYEAFGGLRADVVATDTFGISLLGLLTARYRSSGTDDAGNATTGPTGVFPLSVTLQLYYRLNKQ